MAVAQVGEGGLEKTTREGQQQQADRGADVVRGANCEAERAWYLKETSPSQNHIHRCC